MKVDSDIDSVIIWKCNFGTIYHIPRFKNGKHNSPMRNEFLHVSLLLYTRGCQTFFMKDHIVDSLVELNSTVVADSTWWMMVSKYMSMAVSQ